MISIANNVDCNESLLNAECQHCTRVVDLTDLDQHERECLEILDKRMIQNLIEQQERELDLEEEEEKKVNLVSYHTS